MERGLDQTEAAAKLGISRPHLGHLENRRKYAGPEVALRITKVTGIEYRDLVHPTRSERRAGVEAPPNATD